jgi:uncharacterized protein YeaO (DUF488 family)
MIVMAASRAPTVRKKPRPQPAGVRIKRAYEPASPQDGYRVLVDRLWPRGRSREELRLEAWLKDIAPSAELRRWFDHDPSRWKDFQARYRVELQAPAAQTLLSDLVRRARAGPLTLVYAARDEQYNDAVALRAIITARLRTKTRGEGTVGSGRRATRKK